MPIKLKIDDIIIDAGTQMRAAINNDVVAEYMEARKLPPVVVFVDCLGHNYLADGFHRVEAARRKKLATIEATLKDGELRDAILYAAGANADHGLKRSNEDKRRSVETLLNDDEWSQWSNAEIARKCCVSDEFVRKLRKELTPNVGSETRTYQTKHGTVATMQTGKIGRKRAAERPPESQPQLEPPAEIVASEPTEVMRWEEDEPAESPAVETAAVESPPASHPLEQAKRTRDLFAAWRRDVNSLKKRLLVFAQSADGDALLKHEQSFQQEFAAIHDRIKSEEPHCVCFVCQGEGCDSCEGRGHMTKRRHDSRTPEPGTNVDYV